MPPLEDLQEGGQRLCLHPHGPPPLSRVGEALQVKQIGSQRVALCGVATPRRCTVSLSIAKPPGTVPTGVGAVPCLPRPARDLAPAVQAVATGRVPLHVGALSARLPAEAPQWA